jgi:hypothetical protein
MSAPVVTALRGASSKVKLTIGWKMVATPHIDLYLKRLHH